MVDGGGDPRRVAAIGRLAAGQGKAATPPAVPSPPEVGVIRVQGEAVSTYREYPARTYARDLVEVRGRVDGYVERAAFEIGSDVRAGQVLYVLDVRPYEAGVARAQRRARAGHGRYRAGRSGTLVKARQDVDRLEPLVEERSGAEAGPRQRTRRAPSRRCGGQRPQGVGRSEPRHAAHGGAESGIRDDPRADQRPHRRQPGPGGRPGDARTPPQPLTTIVPLDPIWVRFKVSEAEHASRSADAGAQRDAAATDPGRRRACIRIEGRIENTRESGGLQDRHARSAGDVSESGAARCCPASSAACACGSTNGQSAILVPQKAVQELQGMQSVLTVGPENKVSAAQRRDRRSRRRELGRRAGPEARRRGHRRRPAEGAAREPCAEPAAPTARSRAPADGQ